MIDLKDFITEASSKLYYSAAAKAAAFGQNKRAQSFIKAAHKSSNSECKQIEKEIMKKNYVLDFDEKDPIYEQLFYGDVQFKNYKLGSVFRMHTTKLDTDYDLNNRDRDENRYYIVFDAVDFHKEFGEYVESSVKDIMNDNPDWPANKAKNWALEQFWIGEYEGASQLFIIYDALTDTAHYDGEQNYSGDDWDIRFKNRKNAIVLAEIINKINPETKITKNNFIA